MIESKSRRTNKSQGLESSSVIGLFFASIGFIFTRLYCSTLLIKKSIVSVNQPLQIINWDIPNVVKVYFKKVFHADYFLYYVIEIQQAT